MECYDASSTRHPQSSDERISLMQYSTAWNCCAPLVRKGSFHNRWWPDHLLIREWKGSSNGAAFFTSSFIRKRVLGYNPISDRKITIWLQASHINIGVVQLYAPTSTASDEIIDSFYSELQNVVDSLPKKDVIIVFGDFNQKKKVLRGSAWGGGPSYWKE